MGGTIGGTSTIGDASNFYAVLKSEPAETVRAEDKARDLLGYRVLPVGASDAVLGMTSARIHACDQF